MKKITTPAKKDTLQKEQDFALGKINWLLIGASLLLILIGFLLMTGEPSGVKFNPDIFSTRRITVGPMIALFGFLFMIVAIMWPNKENKA